MEIVDWLIVKLGGVPGKQFDGLLAGHMALQREFKDFTERYGDACKSKQQLQERLMAAMKQINHLLAGGQVVNVRRAKTPFGPMDEVEEFYPDDMNIVTHDDKSPDLEGEAYIRRFGAE